MYYIFNSETKRCMFSADAKVELNLDDIEVESDEQYDISKIHIVQKDGAWSIEVDEVTDADIVLEAKQRKRKLINDSATNIAILTNLAEVQPSEANTAMLNNWKKYQVSLIMIDETSSNIQWPTVPALPF